MEFTSRYRSRIVINAIAPFVPHGSNVLDIGCGNGVISHEIKDALHCRLLGTDILDYSLKEIEFKKMEQSDRLDFNDNEFDTSLFVEVLHHMPFETQLKLIKDALRVSNQVLVFEVESSLLVGYADYLVNQLHNRDMPILYTFRKKEEWVRLFEDNGIGYRHYNVKKPFWGLWFTYHLFRLTKMNHGVNG